MMLDCTTYFSKDADSRNPFGEKCRVFAPPAELPGDEAPFQGDVARLRGAHLHGEGEGVPLEGGRIARAVTVDAGAERLGERGARGREVRDPWGS